MLVHMDRAGDFILIEATLVSISERFGFARPTKAGEDIFIPGRDLNGAFVGDTVILCGLQKRDRGPSGRKWTPKWPQSP